MLGVGEKDSDCVGVSDAVEEPDWLAVSEGLGVPLGVPLGVRGAESD